jgi:hypothetical protein
MDRQPPSVGGYYAIWSFGAREKKHSFLTATFGLDGQNISARKGRLVIVLAFSLGSSFIGLPCREYAGKEPARLVTTWNASQNPNVTRFVLPLRMFR